MNTRPMPAIEPAPVVRGEGENTVRLDTKLAQPGSPRLREVSLTPLDAGIGVASVSNIPEPLERSREAGDRGDISSTLPTSGETPEGTGGTPVLPSPRHRPLPALLLAAGAVLSFHVAYLTHWGAVAMPMFFAFLVAGTRLDTLRRVFNYGVGIGLLCYAPHLGFFWNVFVGPASGTVERIAGITGVGALWMVLPIWLAIFLMLAAFVRRRSPAWAAVLLIPTVWMGIEYFRSELYVLKFSWLNVGYALPPGINQAGMFTAGFAACLLGTAVALLWWRSWKQGLALGLALMGLVLLLGPALMRASTKGSGGFEMAGIQLEFPSENTVLSVLNQLAPQLPETQLFILPEYTFDGPVPERVRDWCRENGKWLVAGGKDPLGTTNYYNTAFVVSTNGEIVFRQVKSVPIQFFRDGLPAPEQRVWESPWGRIGIAICYDLSYTRVTDELIRQGAQLILCPTMDVETWGRYQHELHTRVAPVRAAEYGVPIFRVASSGITQAVDRRGHVMGTLPFPGQGEVLGKRFTLRPGPARLPVDRWLAPVAVGVTALIAAAALFLRLRDLKFFQRRKSPPA